MSDTPETPETTPGKPAPPRKPKNSDQRAREHLLADEVKRLATAAAKRGRYGHRDATMIRVADAHGLRAAELCKLRREQLDLNGGYIHVRRDKKGKPSTQPIGGQELRDLKRLLRESPESPFVFVSERGGAMTPRGFYRIVQNAAKDAKLGIKVHPHMFRHACGYRLANKGADTRAIQDYLGHRNIQHTVRYTELASDRFKGFAGE